MASKFGFSTSAAYSTAMANMNAASVNTWSMQDQAMAMVGNQKVTIPAFLHEDPEVLSAIEQMQGKLDALTGDYDGIVASAEAVKDYPVTLKEALAPLTTSYEEHRARMDATANLSVKRSNEQIQAVKEGSKDARPWVTASLLTDAMQSIELNYAAEMRALGDEYAKNQVATTLQWAQAVTGYDVAQREGNTQRLAVANQLMNSILSVQADVAKTAATYSAQIAGLQADVYNNERRVVAGLATAMLDSTARLETARLEMYGRMAMQEAELQSKMATPDDLDAGEYMDARSQANTERTSGPTFVENMNNYYNEVSSWAGGAFNSVYPAGSSSVLDALSVSSPLSSLV